VYGDDKRTYIRNTSPAQSDGIRRIPEFPGCACCPRRPGGRHRARPVRDELAEGVGAVVGRLGLQRIPHDLVMSGSCWRAMCRCGGLFAARLRRVSPTSRPVPAVNRPIRGALMYAAHRAGWLLPDFDPPEPALIYAR